MVNINRNIVGYIKYLLDIAVVVDFVSYCYSYCRFVRALRNRHWFVLCAFLYNV